MQCKIEGNEIVVRVKIEALPNAWKQSIGGLEDMPRIVDAEAFAPYFVAELNHEDETGTTLLMQVFDDALCDAIWNGADGVVV